MESKISLLVGDNENLSQRLNERNEEADMWRQRCASNELEISKFKTLVE
jgi:hypothetical protein